MAKGEKIPRVLGRQMHANIPGEIIHADFLYMEDENIKQFHNKYVLVIKDDFSGYIDLHISDTCSAKDAANGLASWITKYKCPKYLITDQGSHFSNQMIQELTAIHKIKHHFTVAYSPKSNGTVERVNRDILNVMRSLLLEYRLNPNNWVSLIPIVQRVINHTRSQRLNNKAPITVFTGLEADSPLDIIIQKDNKKFITLTTYDQLKENIIKSIDKMKISMDEMHKDVQLSKEEKRKAAERYLNNKSRPPPPNFIVGDYVLALRHVRSKLQNRWTGPYKIIEQVSSWVYKIKNMIDQTEKEVHVDHLRFYKDSKFEMTPSMKEQMAFANVGYEVEEFLQVKRINGEWHIEVKWKGFNHDDNSWEPISNMIEDVPDKLNEFISRKSNNNKVKKMKQELHL